MNHFKDEFTDKTINISKWYQEILIRGNLISYYDVSGCYILLPNSYGMWENIREYIDQGLKKRGVKNVYFPLFIPKHNLEKEKTHLEDFTPEVAWVTKSGRSELDTPIAIRPTSECAMYPTFPNFIKGHNDLPLKFNQWCNVVRWEFKDPTPFLRSREFLWQEGHTCYEEKEQAMTEVKDILELYSDTYKNILAIPTIKGVKSEKEKFAGADTTLTLEGFISEAGKGIQCCTSHCLGQNFSKMFGIKYQDENMESKYVYQNSWGFTTRSIGIMLMTHGDNKGIINPPKVAPTQIVVIPIIYKKKKEQVMRYSNEVFQMLSKSFRTEIDYRDQHNPRWKYALWEANGVPLRVEVGPRDVENRTIRICRRDTGEKRDISFEDCINEIISEFDLIHNNLYTNAHKKLLGGIEKPATFEDFQKALDNKKICLVRWCDQTSCEEVIKEKTRAKSLCKPLDKEYQLYICENDKCIHCDNKATTSCLFGRSY